MLPIFAFSWSDPADVIYFVLMIIGLIGAIGALVPVAIKLVKNTNKNGDWFKLLGVAMKAMTTAQETDKTGEEKLNEVIAYVKAYAKIEGITIDDDTITHLIDSIGQLKSWYKDMKAATEIADKSQK